MKRFSPTRDLRFAFTLGLSLACGATVCAQKRGGGGGRAPVFRQQGFRQAPQGFRQAPQGNRQAAPEQRQAPVERRAPGGQPAQGQQQSQLAPIVRRNPQAQAQGEKGEHLQAWMNQHRNLTPEQQQQALDREPGFRQLPQATQDRMHNRLAQLNAMNPQTRERTQNHIEWMERLSPDQRQQVRGSMEQLGALPPEQRRQVAQSFRDLRALPQDQRAGAMNSPQYQNMNPAQRAALNNLLRNDSLIPPNGR